MGHRQAKSIFLQLYWKVCCHSSVKDFASPSCGLGLTSSYFLCSLFLILKKYLTAVKIFPYFLSFITFFYQRPGELFSQLILKWLYLDQLHIQSLFSPNLKMNRFKNMEKHQPHIWLSVLKSHQFICPLA